jgi:cell division septation protein DedD
VQLPDGSMVAGVRGVSLPDGAVVRTGPHGRCSAGDVDFGPGIEALVDSGRLRLRPVAAPAAAPDPVTGGTAAITASDPVPPTVPATTATTTTPTTRPVPTRSPVTATGDLVRAGSDAPRSGH